MQKGKTKRHVVSWAALCAGFVFALAALTFMPTAASAADWSVTEYHYQYGDLEQPFTGGTANTTILTLQHASGWKYGENFFFVDWLNTGGAGYDWYGEVYPKFSLGKITGEEIAFGPVKDVGVITGLNLGADPDVQVWFPGVSFALDLPGFAWANWDFFWTINDNKSGGAPKEDDAFFTDFNWATKQAEVLGLKWNIEGHVEYNAEADFQDIPGTRKEWILGQPQVRAEIGELIGLPENTLFAGIEYQFWVNKLGTDVDESAVQALVVWRL